MASAVEQARAIEHSAGVRLRHDLAAVSVYGEDRLRWLNGQITSDARDARDGQGVYGLAVTVRGKIMADLWVLDLGERLLLLSPEAALPPLLQSFERQIIMDDAELRREPDLVVISVQGPRAREVIEPYAARSQRCDELGLGGYFVLVSASEQNSVLDALFERARAIGGDAIDADGYELARLRAGRPRFGVDFGEHEYPQEAGLGARAVSFNKGCYLGQEVVCTLENRGRLSRRLVQLELPPDAASAVGTELADDTGQAVGSLTSTARDPERGHTLALGYVKRAHAVVGRELRAGRSSARIREIVGGD